MRTLIKTTNLIQLHLYYLEETKIKILKMTSKLNL